MLACWTVVASVLKWASAPRAAERFLDNRQFFFWHGDWFDGDAVMETDGIAAVGNGHGGGGFGAIQEGCYIFAGLCFGDAGAQGELDF